MTVKEFAFQTGLHEQTVRARIRDGAINCTIDKNWGKFGLINIPETELKKVVQKQRKCVIIEEEDKNFIQRLWRNAADKRQQLTILTQLYPNLNKGDIMAIVGG